jgi:Uri superfamily endonuclease
MYDLRLPGTYLLIFFLHRACVLKVGRLGHFNLVSGFYVYVGSALGSGGLRARLRHHLKSAKRPHWHIDYFSLLTPPKAIWVAQGKHRREHDWAMLLGQLPNATQPIPKFGASDCPCVSHLYYYSSMPSLDRLDQLIKGRFPEDNAIRTIAIASI